MGNPESALKTATAAGVLRPVRDATGLKNEEQISLQRNRDERRQLSKREQAGVGDVFLEASGPSGRWL